MATKKSVAVFCLNLNFCTLIKLSWSVLLWPPLTEWGTVLFFASVAFCFPILWYSLFPLLVFYLPYLNLLPSITSFPPHLFPLALYEHWNFVILCINLPLPLLWFAISESEHCFRSSCSHPAWNEFCWQKDTAALLNVLKLPEIMW